MAGNIFGNLFRLTTFGESHGAAIGGVIDGCPAGLAISESIIQAELDRRRPGQSALTTQRNESDTVEILSGVFEGISLGTPIGFVIRNKDHRSEDYDAIKNVYRPGHADEVWQEKFGHRDYRGGGRSSARETASRVVGGAVAKVLLSMSGVNIQAYVSSVKDVEVKKSYSELDLAQTESNSVRCPDQETAARMIRVIEDAREAGDTVGGTIICVCRNVPVGWGEPVFDKLQAAIGHAILSINATKGFEMLNGFESTRLFGSENNLIRSGIAGGISTGNDIVFRVAFKPVSTISQKQMANTTSGEKIELEVKGRHDPCVLPRAVPIVEAMAALVLADMSLLAKTNRA